MKTKPTNVPRGSVISGTAHCYSRHRHRRINPTARYTSLAMSPLDRDEGRRGRRGLSREVYKTTRRHPVASSKGGCRRSQSSPPNGRISSRAVHGRPKEPGEYDVVTSIPRPGAIDECAIAVKAARLVSTRGQADGMLVDCLPWMEGRNRDCEPVPPQEMNASIARTHQFNGFLGSSVVNLWPYLSGPPEGISTQVYINPCECTREHPSHGHCQRSEAVVSGSPIVKGEGPRE